MSGDMMAKKVVLGENANAEALKLDPEGLKALGLSPDASFGEVVATALEQGLEKVESLETPEEREAYIAKVAAIHGMTAEEYKARIEAAMNMTEDQLLDTVMSSPLGRLIEQDLARADDAKKQTGSAASE